IRDDDLAVVKLHNVPGSDSEAGGARFSALRSAIDSDPSLSDGPPVYETPTGGGQVALIPVNELIVKFKESTPQATRQRIHDDNRMAVQHENYPEPGAYLVTLPKDVDVIELANQLEESGQVEFAEPNFVHLSSRVGDIMQTGVGVGPALTPGYVGTSYAGSIEYQPAADGMPTFVATDPAFSSQWNLQKIQAPSAWDI